MNIGEESLKSKLKRIKDECSKQYVTFYNDGTIRRENAYLVNSNMENGGSIYYMIKHAAGKCVESYSEKGYDFNKFDYGLLLGVIYKDEYVNEDNTLKEGAKPLNNIVHCYNMEFNAYDGNTKYHEDNLEQYSRYQGYIDYRLLKTRLKRDGFTTNLPKNFNELKKDIFSGENKKYTINFELSKSKQKVKTK